jgi:hypothetical protein
MLMDGWYSYASKVGLRYRLYEVYKKVGTEKSAE